MSTLARLLALSLLMTLLAGCASWGDDEWREPQVHLVRVDLADLDGAALLSDDPFHGATIDRGRIALPLEPGLGVRRR